MLWLLVGVGFIVLVVLAFPFFRKEVCGIPLTPVCKACVPPNRECPLTPLCPPCNPDHCKRTGVALIGSMQWLNTGPTIQPIKLYNITGFRFGPDSVGADISLVFPPQPSNPLSVALNQQSPFSGKINSVDVSTNTITVTLPRIYRYLPNSNADAVVNASAFIY